MHIEDGKASCDQSLQRTSLLGAVEGTGVIAAVGSSVGG